MDRFRLLHSPPPAVERLYGPAPEFVSLCLGTLRCQIHSWSTNRGGGRGEEAFLNYLWALLKADFETTKSSWV